MINSLIKYIFLSLLSFMVTTTAFAGNAVSNAQKSENLFDQFSSMILTPLLSLFSVSALVYFLFGIARYFVTKDQNEEARSKLGRHLLWGFFGLFIIFSIGGIIRVISTFVG
jgi:hypothetical protein